MLLNEFVLKNDLKCNIKIDYEIGKVVDDSRIIQEFDIFVVIKGLDNNGYDYLNSVIDKKVKTIIIDEDVLYDNESLNIIKVKNTKTWYLDYLIKENKEIFNKLKVIGVTGTNGKTTSSYLIYNILKKYKNVMLAGTNGSFVSIKGKEYRYKTKNTTPKLNVIVDILLKHPNIKYLILEISSDAVENNRLGDLKFDIICLTNIGHDHANTHKCYENYIQSKVNLFKKFKKSKYCVAVLNNDDKYYKVFSKAVDKNIRIVSYGINKGDIRGDILSINNDHMMVKVVDYEHEMILGTNLLGRFNVYNILLAIKVCEHLGIPFSKIIDAFAANIEIEGRYNKYLINNRQVYIDYAHNPEAIKEFLCLINQISDERIITVIGAGGCRDKLKRGMMGYYAKLYSDIVIFTEDTSREEDVKEIIEGLVSEIEDKNYYIEYNRVAAIKKAFYLSKEKENIILLGMGEDSYGTNNEFTDYKVVKLFEV